MIRSTNFGNKENKIEPMYYDSKYKFRNKENIVLMSSMNDFGKSERVKHYVSYLKSRFDLLHVVFNVA